MSPVKETDRKPELIQLVPDVSALKKQTVSDIKVLATVFRMCKELSPMNEYPSRLFQFREVKKWLEVVITIILKY